MELGSLDKLTPIKIGYYNPFDVFPVIQSEIEAKFPLTNLHWKYHPLRPVKSIPLLPIELIEEVPKSGNHEVDSEGIYLRLMFVKIDNLDTYRSQVRPLIKAWLTNLVAKSNVEWGIIFFIPASGKDKQSSLIKTSAFDKLKLDFGLEGKELAAIELNSDDDPNIERFFKIKEVYPDKLQKLEANNELINSIKVLLLRTFNNNYDSFNNKLTELNSSKVKSVANNLPKFVMKLKIANLFSDMKLLQDSLDIYNELSSDLHLLQVSNPDLFDGSVSSLPKTFDKIETLEASFDIKAIKQNILNLKSSQINLMEIKILIFINQSILSQTLAHYSKSISISSIFISNLFYKLIVFINDLSTEFNKSQLDEWFYIIIDQYLNIPVCNKIIELNNKVTDESQKLLLSEINEFKGELRLVQRSLLANLAERKGFQLVGIIQDIPLDDDKPSSKPSELTYKPLTQILTSNDTYYDHFEILTESIIHDFVSSGRSKTIDILSIDLAILNYKRRNFGEALNILQNSYEFFIQNGWKFMGGILLEIYLDCIESIEKKDEKQILSTCIKLFSNLIHNDDPSCGINNYALTKNTQQIAKIFDKILSYSSEVGEIYEYPINKIFQIKILSLIKPDSNPTDKHCIEIELYNPFGIEFSFDNIVLSLISSLDENETLTFSTSNLKISVDTKQTIALFTNDFILGEFQPTKLSIQVNENLFFVQDLVQFELGDTTVANNTTLIHYSQNSFLTESVMNTSLDAGTHKQTISQSFLFYQNLKKFRCEFMNPQRIELGTTSVLLRINNGEGPIENVQVEIISATSGLIIGKIKEKLIDRLEAYAVKDIPVPYSYSNENKFVEFKAKLSYLYNGEKYNRIIKQQVDKTLTISVSVQDIFKSDFVFSKFQVGTSNPKLPIRITGNELKTTNDNYEIFKPDSSYPGGSLVAFGEQPASFFYKIVPKKGYSIHPSDSLELLINYSNLHGECIKIIEEHILNYLIENELSDYWFLIRNQLFRHFKFNLNHFAIYKVIKITNTYEMETIIERIIQKYVTKEINLKLLRFFQTFLSKELLLDSSKFEDKELFISVPVPLLSLLQIVEFEYEKKEQYFVGEPIVVKLKVESTTKWADFKNLANGEDANTTTDKDTSTNGGDISILAESSPQKNLSQQPKPDQEEFQIMIVNDENWLISGFKKQSFEIDLNKLVSENQFELVLIPLNIGKLLLPRISIKSSNTTIDKSFSIDIAIKNGLETLLIVPELDSITFSF